MLTHRALAATNLYNRVSGTINSESNITTTSENFTNNNDVIAAGNITINTTNTFNNSTLTTSGISPSIQAGALSETGTLTTIIDQQSGGFIITTWEDTLFKTSTTSSRVDGLVNGGSIPSKKAQIIANGGGSQLAINYGSGSAENSLSILSANTLNINGTGTFTNKDFTLYKRDYTSAYLNTREWDALSDNDYRYFAATTPGAAFNASVGNPSDYNPGPGWVSSGSGANAKVYSLENANLLVNTSVVSTTGAGIFAGTFNFTGGTFVNEGSPNSGSTSSANQGGGIGIGVAPPTNNDEVNSTAVNNTIMNGTTSVNNAIANGATTVNSAIENGATTVNGTTVNITTIESNKADSNILSVINVTLPTNPNGFFVKSKKNNSKYVIEANPLFGVNSNFVGSGYMEERYGFEPSDTIKRLGDANYEAYLIRQQLISKTGRNVLNVGESESAQMQRLMDSAFSVMAWPD